MFRALLWKEWRELWALLVAAAALAALSSVIMQSEHGILKPTIWELSFSAWLFVGAFYLPTHLFAREDSLRDVGFISFMPLDRFRLWWFRLVICVSLVVLIAVVLYGTTTFLGQFYRKIGAYEVQKIRIVQQSVAPAIFLFSLSLFFSTIFRRQFLSIAGTLVLLIAISVAWSIAASIYQPLDILRDFFSKRDNNPSFLFLSSSPILLFLSLLIFARNDMRRRTRSYAVLWYLPAAVAAVTVSAGTITVSVDMTKLKNTFERNRQFVRIEAVSGDGNYLLISDDHSRGRSLNRTLLGVDIFEKKAYGIGDDFLYLAQISPYSDSLVYERGRLKPLSSAQLVLSDFRGGQKKVLLKKPKALPSFNATWSRCGAYVGITNSAYRFLKSEPYVAIANSQGNHVEKYEFPVLESDDSIFPIGWDSRTRFYFCKGIKKRSGTINTFWRIGPGNNVPERVQILPDKCTIPSFSPNGKWIACIVNKTELWVTEVSSGKSNLVTGDWYSFNWSPDSRLAYLEVIWNQGGSEGDEGSEKKPLHRLVLYDPASRISSHYSLANYPIMGRLGSWSLSGKHLLLLGSTQNRSKRKLYVFSTETGAIQPIHLSTDYWNIHWVSNERFMWQAGNILYISNVNGTDQREFFRVEGDSYLFPDEAQS